VEIQFRPSAVPAPAAAMVKTAHSDRVGENGLYLRQLRSTATLAMGPSNLRVIHSRAAGPFLGVVH
jgi:hypothetical protein